MVDKQSYEIPNPDNRHSSRTKLFPKYYLQKPLRQPHYAVCCANVLWFIYSLIAIDISVLMLFTATSQKLNSAHQWGWAVGSKFIDISDEHVK